MNRISADGVTVHAGCRIFGSSTLILSGAILGEEAPATVDDCLLGRSVRLKGGYFSEAVFLEGATAGSGAHVRGGTILEEGASIAHCVGLKQTILFPYVTLGSLINFCDIFMAGGAGPKDHSEVGSSYIHFNFTPHQDKATPSLLGDVPRGVMLNRPPIFLGGQGGLVGPCRLEYGTVIAAGTICRKDVLRPDRLIAEGGGRPLNMPFRRGAAAGLRRIVGNNVLYIANLVALRHWYRDVRSRFVDPDGFPEAILHGLIRTLDAGIEERIRRLEELAGKLSPEPDAEIESKPPSSTRQQGRELCEGVLALGQAVRRQRETDVPAESRDRLLDGLGAATAAGGKGYPETIRALSPETKAAGTRWLQAVVDDTAKRALASMPSFREAP